MSYLNVHESGIFDYMCWHVILCVQLPDNAALTSISARFNNGVLIVSVPKIARKEPEVTDIPIDEYLDSSAQ